MKHSFLIHEKAGTFRITLRASYWTTIHNEKELRDALLRSFEQPRNQAYYQAMKKHYEAGEVLYCLRQYGMISISHRTTQ